MYRLYSLVKNKIFFVMAFAVLFGLVLSPNLAGAAVDPATGIDPENVFGTKEIKATTQLGDQNLQVTATKIINVALGLLGIVSVVIILIGGFKWMTAGGNDEQVGEARKWIFSGIIGLAIILSAWAIARFVLENLGKATDIDGQGSNFAL